MKYVIVVLMAVTLFGSVTHAQTDFDRYPIRPLVQLAEEHATEENKKVDFVISADPFPSKTAVIVSGEHRAIPADKKKFIQLWFETRNLPKENADVLVNEYRFTEGEKDYWLPVVAQLEPFIAEELKKGDGAVLFYFFMGGYSRTTREWVFVVEEFHKVQ